MNNGSEERGRKEEQCLLWLTSNGSNQISAQVRCGKNTYSRLLILATLEHPLELVGHSKTCYNHTNSAEGFVRRLH